MRVIALVSLALALMASSLPLSAITDELSAGEDRLIGIFGSTNQQSAATGKGDAGVEKLSSRSIVNSLVGSNPTGSGTNAASQLGGAESIVGKVTSATNPATHGTPLRWRTTTENVPGAGTVTNKVTGGVDGAGKATKGEVNPSGAEGTAKGAAAGSPGSLTGSGLDTQTGGASA